MSESTAGEEPFYWDATTGEPCPREGNVLCALPWRDGHRHTHTCPATPDAGDASNHPPSPSCSPRSCGQDASEPLSEENAQRRALEDWMIDNRWALEAYDFSHALIASDWLAEVKAAAATRARAEALREAARDARSSPSTRVGDLHPGEVWAAWLDGRADSLTPDTAGDS